MQLYELMAALEKSGMQVDHMHGVARMYKASMSSEDFLSETKRAIDNRKYKSANALVATAIYARDVNACCGALEHIINSCPQHMRYVREYNSFDFINAWFGEDVYFKINASGGATRSRVKPLTKKELSRLRNCYDFLHFGEYENSVSESSMAHGLVKSLNKSNSEGMKSEVNEWVSKYIIPKVQKNFAALDLPPNGKARELRTTEIYIKTLTTVASGMFRENAKVGFGFINMMRNVEKLWGCKKFFVDILQQIKNDVDKVSWIKDYEGYVLETGGEFIKHEWTVTKNEIRAGKHGDANWLQRYELIEQTKALEDKGPSTLNVL